MVCDRAVDTQYRQQSVYVLGEREEAYTDNDFELYGRAGNGIGASGVRRPDRNGQNRLCEGKCRAGGVDLLRGKVADRELQCDCRGGKVR